ncbi:hypothetical protein DL769_005513 [Monosporascus sp. CRB-8-3]|nr:hypothetical protein DL769_005513 [Monosporascus sp. CRB-8-3]
MAKLLSPNFTEFYNFEWFRILGIAPVYGADVAECFEAASKVKPNDPETWYTAWTEAIDVAKASEERVFRSGDREAARRAFLQLSYNWNFVFMLMAPKSMLHYLHNDPRLLDIMAEAINTFRQATVLFDSSVHILEIRYENVRLPTSLIWPKSPPADRG